MVIYHKTFTLMALIHLRDGFQEEISYRASYLLMSIGPLYVFLPASYLCNYL